MVKVFCVSDDPDCDWEDEHISLDDINKCPKCHGPINHIQLGLDDV